MRAALLAILVLLTVHALPTASAVGAPVLSVGDFWEVDSTYDVPQAGPQSITVTTTVEARESVTVEGATYDTWRTGTHSEMEFGGEGYSTMTKMDTKSWSRASDGASVKATTHTETTSNIPGFPGSTSDSQTVYTPPCVNYQFPIVVGSEWTATCTTKTTTSSSASPNQETTNTTTTHYKVIRAESVTVPAGTFDALVLETTTDSTKVYSWYAAAACAPVKTSISIDGSDYSSQLKSYKCAKSGETQTGGTTTTTTTPTGTTTTSTTTTTTTTPTATTSATPAATETPGPALPIVLAVLAGVVILMRRRA